MAALTYDTVVEEGGKKTAYRVAKVPGSTLEHRRNLGYYLHLEYDVLPLPCFLLSIYVSARFPVCFSSSRCFARESVICCSSACRCCSRVTCTLPHLSISFVVFFSCFYIALVAVFVTLPCPVRSRLICLH